MLAGLLVLALGQRVDRADLRAAALEALQPAVDLGPLLVAERLLGRRRPPRRGARRSRPAPAASARRSPSWVASTSASVSSSAAAFISAWSSNSCREQARSSSAISSPSPSPPTTWVSVRSTRARISGPAARPRHAAGLVEQPLARRDPRRTLRGGARRGGPRRGGRGGTARSAPPRTAPSAASRSRLGGIVGAGSCQTLDGLPRPASISPSSSSSCGARSPGPCPGRVERQGAELGAQRLETRLELGARGRQPGAATAIRSCSPRSLVRSPQAWVRSRSRAAKRSSAARRRSLTSASRFSTRRGWRGVLGGLLRCLARSAPNRRSSPTSRARSSSSSRSILAPSSAAWAWRFSGRSRARASRSRSNARSRLSRAARASARPAGGACGACRGRRPPRPGAAARAASSGRSTRTAPAVASSTSSRCSPTPTSGERCTR